MARENVIGVVVQVNVIDAVVLAIIMIIHAQCATAQVNAIPVMVKVIACGVGVRGQAS